MEQYGVLLEEAYKEVKVVKDSKANGRFDVPEVKIEIIGNKTVICNYIQICSYIRRKNANLCKFLSKELAAYCKSEGERLILNRKIPEKQVKEKINLYIKKFVICQECGKPDTEILKEGQIGFIKCLACGAKHSLGKI